MSYYSGDPGFLSFFKNIGHVVTGLFKSPTVQKVATPIAKVIGQHPTLSAAGGSAIAGYGAGELVSGRRTGQPGMMPPMRMPGGAGMGGAMPAGLGARGYHMSKPRRGVPSHLVRNRRMRVTNPRALRRAIRRARGFEKLARKVMHFVSTKKHSGRAVFRGRRRK